MQFKNIIQYSQDLNVLYVEDNEDLLKETLLVFENYFDSIDVAINGQRALELYKENKYDLVITDINMPIMDGKTLIKEVHDINLQQDIIVVSAYNNSEQLLELIQLNISNFILKPLDIDQLSSVMYNTCKNIFAKKRMVSYHNDIDQENHILDDKVKELAEEVLFTQRLSLETIANMIENYDNETGSHTKRIEKYTQLLVNNVPEYKNYPIHLKEFISYGSLLHDIGKLFIAKEILIKPSQLTQKEFEIMKTHPLLGGEMLNKANETFKNKFHKDSFLKVAAEIAYYHHEKWDGDGYPKGLKEHAIPISARIVAIVDVYDALRSKRVYKDPFTHKHSVEIINDCRGTHFDPMLVDLFIVLEKEFDEIFNRFSGEEHENKK